MPVRLQDRAEEALAHARLTSHREDLAIIESFIIDEYEALGETDSAEMWQAAQDAHGRCLLFNEETPTIEVSQAAWSALGKLLANGLGYQQRVGRIVGFIDQRRKSADSENKRMHQLQQFTTALEINALFAAILSLTREVIKDKHERAALGAGIIALVRRNASVELDGGGE